jgi:protoporphyrinogen IX oxidase
VSNLLTSLYPWVKTLHIFAVISWMAGLLYLPRLFVYHAERGSPGSALSDVFKTMEMRLFFGIMTPAMGATWLFGATLALTPGLVAWRHDGWIYVKLGTVVFLSWFHSWLGNRRKDFFDDVNRVSGRRWRMLNEIPAVALLVILVMVVVRPF